ncbi:MAG: aminotransferase class V-fold PLP-dependent enzyme [Planctomycetes bacterium]|nr:aminotransferase class V-fold PLP-dependent enzyme [Planctomycetota bacterium]
MTDPIQLDAAATTPLDARVLEAMLPWFTERAANASTRSGPGARARAALEEARERVARACGARASGVVFTSGATEANNLALLGAARARAKHGRRVLVGSSEHACVRECALALGREGFVVDWLALDTGGLCDLERAAELLREDTVLVAQMLVHNESGAVHPVRELARLVRSRAPRAHLHVDAVQALGKLELSLLSLGADSLALSAHKLHGPQGAGALVLSGERPLAPITFGGGQERGLRPGTENLAAIVGFGLAAELAERERPRFSAAAERWRADFLAGLAALGGWRVLEPQVRVPAILGLVAPEPASEIRRNHLEARGILTGAGSACQATKANLSPSLAALGLDEASIRRFLRLSLSRESVACDPGVVVEALRAVDTELARPARSAR